MRGLLLGLLLTIIAAAGVEAQAPVPASASMTITPGSGDLQTAHVVSLHGMPAGTPVAVVLFDPTGAETAVTAQTDANGALSVPFDPPAGGQWTVGLYRVVAGLPGGPSLSGTFVAGDGSPHLFAEPYQPSPFSAYNFVGIGLPPNADLEVDLTLTAGLGTHPLPAHTDANGAFSIFAWPAQFNLPFFVAGDNEVSIAGTDLVTIFRVREHAVAGNMTIPGPIYSGSGLGVQIQLRSYAPDHYVWGVYANMSGQTAGEFLAGPTDAGGRGSVILPLTSLPPGSYLMATPYDWGETPFSVVPEPATSTPLPVPTQTATVKPGPTPQGHHHKKHKKHKKRKKQTKP